jgi:hypothetical protein
VKESSYFCQDGRNAPMYSGTMLKNNDNSMEYICYI